MADELGQRVLSMGMELLGPYGVLRGAPAGPGSAARSSTSTRQWGHTLAGGTSEIQRTTIAVRASACPPSPARG